MPNPSPKVLDGVAITSRGDVVLVLWEAPARLHRARFLFDELDAYAAKIRGGIIALQLILPTASPPDAQTRAENHARLRTLGGSLRRVVTVPLGSALWIALVRTVMRGMAVVSGASKVRFVCDDEASGLDALLTGAGPETPSREVLVEAVDDLYRALSVARAA